MYRALLIVLVLVLIGLQYRLWIADGSLAEVHRLQEKKAALQASMERGRARNRALAAEIDNLESGKEAMIGRARSDVGMIKQGETFYLTVEPGDKDNKGRGDHKNDNAPPIDGR